MNLPVQEFTGATRQPGSIGRFEIVRPLGQGAQGVVYLAYDPQLDRHVAIKTLDRRRQDHSQLLQEARNVSKLEHPNIIPIYEIGVHEELPYLVYQYCEGETLREQLDKKGKYSTTEAASIVRQLLDAIGFAHRNSIVHRDLNPANIMLVENGVPRIMDFGISIMLGTGSQSKEIAGTVNYMAPEQVSNNEIGPSVDIFALGLILHEMLTGNKVFTADNTMAIIYKITNENILPPSRRESSIDEQLDKITMQALERDLSKRYETAAEMKADLDIYTSNSDNSNKDLKTESDDRAGTVQFLLRRMKRKQDFPAISTHITQINKKTSNRDNSSANELANVILKDYALTTKLLRLVNTSFYGQFGGEITTISRAVVILGYEQVRAAALSIMLFEHLNNSSQIKELKKAACTALMSGIIAREQAKNTSRLKESDIETVFIASMFHKLGKLLTIYYLPEEYGEIQNLILNKEIKEQQAVVSVLGASYEDLGKGIAKDWQLPDVITNSMTNMPKGPILQPKTASEHIYQLANFSNELSSIGTREGDLSQALEELSKRYSKALKISVKDIKKLVEVSKTEIKEFTRTLNIDIDDVTPFSTNKENTKEEDIKVITKKNVSSENDDSPFETSKITPLYPNNDDSQIENTSNRNTQANITSDADVKEGNSPVTQSSLSVVTEYSTHEDIPASEIDLHDRQETLVRGIAEITNTMLEDYNLNDVLTMILETIYRGMGFTRVLFCVRDIKNNMLIGRFGLGKNISDIIPQFRSNLNGEDVFANAVKHNQEYIILDVNAVEYKHQVPDWVRRLTMPCSIVIYPLILNKRCIGLIYADTDDASNQPSQEALRFFKTLRNQASLAIQQIQMR